MPGAALVLTQVAGAAAGAPPSARLAVQNNQEQLPPGPYHLYVLRRTNMYAKHTGRLQERLDVYWIVHNFVRVHFTTRQVPAVALGGLEYGFSLNEIFLIQTIG
jgi:hypothetical protein